MLVGAVLPPHSHHFSIFRYIKFSMQNGIVKRCAQFSEFSQNNGCTTYRTGAKCNGCNDLRSKRGRRLDYRAYSFFEGADERSKQCDCSKCNGCNDLYRLECSDFEALTYFTGGGGSA